MSSSNPLIDCMNELDKLAVSNFREYLRIPSVQPDPDYESCVTFLEKQANDLGLPFQVYRVFPNKPIVIVTWVGQEPKLPTILLNSHMDVVPVFEEEWIYKPFDAHMDENGDIYARGAQDMKSVGIQYLEAIRRLKKDGVVLKRTVHVSFVPDEEIGGAEGMQAFVKTEDFQELNVGFALDESMPSSGDQHFIFYGERAIWQMRIHCRGEPGHAAGIRDNTAGEKVRYMLDKIYDFRAAEKKKVECGFSMSSGEITSVNVTQLEGGVQANVIPPELMFVVDCRVAVTMDMEKWEKMLNQWCKEAGEDVWIEYISKQPPIPITKLDESNPYWMAFKETADKMNLKIVPWICPGATDARYLRELSIPAIGYSPIDNNPGLLHRENERLNVRVFLRSIDKYCKFIPAIANVADFA